MAQHYTKNQAKKAILAIQAKSKKLFLDGYIPMKDLEAILRITSLRFKQI